MKQNNLDNTDRCIQWQKDRGLDKMEFNLQEAIYRYLEEIYEMRGFDSKKSKSLARENVELIEKLAKQEDVAYPHEHTIVDAIADLGVFGCGDFLKLNYDIKKVQSEVLDEISSRKGAWSDEKGKWIKDPDQDSSTLYKADFTKCKL